MAGGRRSPVKTLHLLRHAKSAWDRPSLPDRERGLNRRGRRDAPRMGAALARRTRPMPVYVSAAKRARLTLEGLCSGWPALAAMPHRVDEELYTFSSEDLFHWIAARDDGVDAVLLIGHNPALTDLVNALCGRRCVGTVPTAGYVRLSLHIDRWRDLLQGCAVIEERLFPKELPDP